MCLTGTSISKQYQPEPSEAKGADKIGLISIVSIIIVITILLAIDILWAGFMYNPFLHSSFSNPFKRKNSKKVPSSVGLMQNPFTSDIFKFNPFKRRDSQIVPINLEI